MKGAEHPPGTLPPPSAVGAHPSRHGYTGGYMPPEHAPAGTFTYAPSHAPSGSGPGGGPATVLVEAPKIEMQPWARSAWRWLVDNTTGVARVDLRRPTPPQLEQYDGNLLVVRPRHSVGSGGGGGKGRFGGRGRRYDTPAAPAYATPVYGQPVYYPQQPQMVPGQGGGIPMLAGARIKITRSFLLGGARRGGGGGGKADGDGLAAGAAADGTATGLSSSPPPAPLPTAPRGPKWLLSRSWAEKPLLDVGVGVNLDVEQQQIQPVARIKIKDLLSIKAFPFGHLKISRCIPLGPVALKFRYELPLAHADRFWEPPARLMVRLDSAAGSGVHLTPGGLEFDEQVLRFGDAVTLRASAGLSFPRQLPWSEEDGPPFRVQLHRLSLKSIW